MTHAFRFQTLLEDMQRQEEQQTLVLAAAVQAERVERQQLAALEASRERTLAQPATSDGVVDTEETQATLGYLDHIAGEIARQQLVIEARMNDVDEARAELLRIVRRRQSYDRLRERDEAVAQDQEQRRDDAAVDDLNMARHARSRRPA